MEKPPIISKVKGKFGRLANAENYSDEEHPEQENDVLEQFNIPLNITVPDSVLTPKELSSLRFTLSEPRGFNIKEVESFYGKTQKTLEFYVKALEKRNRDIHKLATEVDKYQTDTQNLKYQLEFSAGSGEQAMRDSHGNYVTESSMSNAELDLIDRDNTIIELNNEILMLRKDVELARRDAPNPNAAPSINTASNLSSDDHAELMAFRENQVKLVEWEKAVEQAYGELESQVKMLQDQLAGGGQVDTALVEREEQLQETTALLHQAEGKIAEFEQFTEDNAIYVSQLKAEIEEIPNLQAAYDESVIQQEALREQLVSLTSSFKEQADELVNAINITSQIEEEKLRLNDELKQVQAHFEKAPDATELDRLKKLADDLNAHIDTLEAHIQTLNSNIDEKNGEIEKSLDTMDKMQAKIEELSSRSAAPSTPILEGYTLPPGVNPEDLV